LENGIVPTRSLVALGVVGILLGLVTWAIIFLALRHRYTTLAVAVIAALSALIAWVIIIWPAYWD
jgi:tetrahydromethanopterin S-methyltransferase subunit D